jgi:hypothetical protein
MNLMQNPLRSPDRVETYLTVVNKTITGAPVITNAMAQEWAKTIENLTSLIDYVTDYAEQETSLALREQTVSAVYLSCGMVFDLPIRGALAITNIKDKNGDNIDTTEYELVGNTVLFREARPEKTTVTYTAHYQSSMVELAILKLTLSHFEDRQDNVIGSSVQELKNSSRAILRPLMRY